MENNKYLLFVGSYAKKEMPSIHGFMYDETKRELIPHGSYAGISSPSFLTIHPNGKWIYAVSETGMVSDGVFGEVHAFKIDADNADNLLQPINNQSTDGDWPCHLVIDGSGQWIVATNYGSGNAALYPILADGGLGEMKSFVQHQGKGPNQARQEGPHAHSATFTPDNRYVIIADLGIDKLMVYAFDENNGSLSLHDEIESGAGDGPRHLAFHPNGEYVLVANELGNSVTVCKYDEVSGSLTPTQSLDSLPEKDPESTIADIHFSTSGEFVYVSNRGHNSIATYRFGSDSKLTLLGIFPCGGNWPRNFALSLDGKTMLIANRRSNQISVLPILSDGAEIGEPIAQVAVDNPSCIEFL